MKNQKGVSMITLIITIIVIIILAAIAFIGMDDATGNAQFAGFTQEFGDYGDNFRTTPVGNLRTKYSTEGVYYTDAQYYYMAATGAVPNPTTGDDTVSGNVVPAGDTFPALFADGNKGNITSLAADDVCYTIADDSKVATSYKAAEKFYGDNLGTETHYVSEKGFVFTLPGYPRKVDDQYRMYISETEYYLSDEQHSNIGAATKATPVEALTATTEAPATGD